MIVKRRLRPPLGGEEAASALELTLMLARRPRSPERFTRPVVTAQTTMALPSVRVVLGHSDGTNDFASVVTVRIVLEFPSNLLPMRLPSSKLEYVFVSVMLFDVIACSAVESAIDMGEDSFIMETQNAMANGEAQGSEALRCGSWSSSQWACDALRRHQFRVPPLHRWTTQYLECKTGAWEGQMVGDAWTSGSAMGAITVAGPTIWAKTLLRTKMMSQCGKVSLGPHSRGI